MIVVLFTAHAFFSTQTLWMLAATVCASCSEEKSE
jgi:hypothetical protein